MLAVAPVPPAVTILCARVQDFLGQSGFPVVPYTTAYAPQQADPSLAAGWSYPGEVFIPPASQPAVQSLAARLGTRGRLNYQQVGAAQLLLHEGLHQTRYGMEVRWREGAVDAIARDLLPIFTARLYGYTIGPSRYTETLPGSYEPEVTQVRQLSTLRSGAPNYWSYPARAWRAEFLRSDGAARDQMARGAR